MAALLLLAGLALLAVTVGLIAHAVSLPRLRASMSVARVGAYGYPVEEADTAAADGPRGWLDRVAERVGGAMLPRLKEGEAEELRSLLVAAGAYELTPGRFLGYRALGAAAFVTFWLLVGPNAGLDPLMFLLILPVMLGAGWTIPLSIVRVRADRRRAAIDRELPEFVDSLVVTVEAGVGFAGAMRLAADSLTGPLGDEIQLMLREREMGLAPDVALRNLNERVGTPAMQSFARAVIQAEQLGVSVGSILRSLAIEMRTRRRITAEERAQKAPVKMLFPLVFCIFPAMLLVLLYPAITEFLKAFGN